MKTGGIIAAIFFGLSGSIAEAAPGEPSTPMWVWPRGDTDRVTLTHSFDLDQIHGEFVLTVTSDFAIMDVFVNGNLVGALEACDPVTVFPIQEQLNEGENQISLEAAGVEGPSAVAAELRFQRGDGQQVVSRSGDNTWTGENLVEKGHVLPERWAPHSLPDVPHSAEYNQWKEALTDNSASSLSPMPPGFSASLIRHAEDDEDSWVSLVRDPQGRLVIAKETRGLLRFSLDEDRREVVQVETINDDLEECRGLVFQGETLYANANDSKALYRLRDTNGDERFDEVVEIQATTGSVGHGRNDLATGPQGRLHSIHGDSVTVPERASFLTADEDPRSKPMGHWLTLGAENQDWTVLARGLRNPYGIDFNSHGEAFTYDADNEGDVGLPFYHPSRIVHLVAGGNYGWHQRPGNTRSLPVYAPDSLPTTFDVGRGSPTGVKFVPREQWSSRWNDVLLALDWAYGRIVAITMVPRGASYSASGSVFLEGRPLNVTDLEFDEAGILWFITGGRKTKSALYRIAFDPGQEETRAPRHPAQAVKRKAFSAKQRDRRRQISLEKGPIQTESLCWKYLGSDDPWLRHAARVRLERRPTSEWKGRLPGLPDEFAQLTGALALARQGSEPERLMALALASNLSPDVWREPEKLTYLRIAELAAGAGKIPNPAERTIGERALSWITSPETPVSREAVRLLALLDRPETIEVAQNLMAESRTQSDQLFYLEMLGRVRRGWNEANRSRFFKSLAIARQVSRGDRFLPPFFKAIEEDALASLPKSERGAWAELLRQDSISTIEEEKPRPFVRNWTLADFNESDFEPGAVDHGSGLRLFRAGLCHRCHLFGTEGIPVGPDLSQAGNRYTAMDLLQSILEPSSVVAEVYRNVAVEKKSGDTISGRLVRDDFRNSKIYLSTNPFAPRKLTTVPKSEILTLTQSQTSPMPPGLLSGMTKDEIIALIRWLRIPPVNRVPNQE